MPWSLYYSSGQAGVLAWIGAPSESVKAEPKDT
jgi:hypothetical protein